MSTSYWMIEGIGIDVEKIRPHLNKRKVLRLILEWWQFWKPRYKSSTFRYMGESEVETDVEDVHFVGNGILPHLR